MASRILLVEERRSGSPVMGCGSRVEVRGRVVYMYRHGYG